jgi:cytochrome o ubiquinol oxidase subunit 2
MPGNAHPAHRTFLSQPESSQRSVRKAALFWLFAPAGPVARLEMHALLVDLAVLAIVVVPALLLLIAVAWRYRKRRKGQAAYRPEFTHSLKLEAIVWGIPLLVVGVLGVFSYVTTHAVNPYDPRVLASAGGAAASQKPLQVDVIATDWQWLFIYPRQHIAVANELVLPAGRRVDFRLTATSAMNSFFIPQVVGQIYAMPGMRTRQATQVDATGTYHGFSAEFSGAGFSWMHYPVHVLAPARFAAWLHGAARTRERLDWPAFARFARPTVHLHGGAQRYARVQPGLFDEVIRRVRDGRLRERTPIYLSEDMHSPTFLAHVN